MTAGARRSFPWVAVIGMLVALGVGSFVLLDMKPWTARKFQDARPAPTLKILGRDDPATLEAQRAEREEERRRRLRPAPPASASSTSAPSTTASASSAPSATSSSGVAPATSASSPVSTPR